jgi:flagellar protein FlbD
VETDPDTVVPLVDGTKYVVAESFDGLLRSILEHRSITLVARQRLAGGVAQIAARPTPLRVERRARSRDTTTEPYAPGVVLPDPDGD